MAYTPNTWATGDTITAAKLNNMESGIANACTVASVSLSATGFDYGSKTFGYIVYASYNNGTWVVVKRESEDWDNIFGSNTPTDSMLPTIIIPPDENVRPFLIPQSGISANVTGGIGPRQNVFHPSGSLIINGGYKISGSGSVEFVAD